MAAYNYTALTTQGSTQSGVLEGDSPRHIRQKLRQQGLTPLEVNVVIGNKLSEKKFTFARIKRLRHNELALLTRQLATLLAAGLPLEESLLGVSEQSDKAHVNRIIMGVRSRVLEGHTLANSMRNFPQSFPELYCATVGAGEQTGRLDLVLNRLADYTEQQQHMHQKIQQALIYPALMTFVSISIVTFLLVFVVPKIIAVFQSTGQTLPEVTIILITISEDLTKYGLYLLIFITAAIFLFRRLLRQKRFLTKWHHFQLRLPLIGYAIKTINTARYARTFGILSAAGVSILEAMRVSATLMTSIPIEKSVTHAANRVREGANISLSLKQTGYFSPMMIHLIASGEASGSLEQMLEKAADNQDNDVKRMIETGLTLFEPMIILLMGAVVLFIVLAILLPIFQLDQLTG